MTADGLFPIGNQPTNQPKNRLSTKVANKLSNELKDYSTNSLEVWLRENSNNFRELEPRIGSITKSADQPTINQRTKQMTNFVFQ